MKAQTDALWQEGQKTNWESMSHTEAGAKRFNLEQNAQIHRGFMTSMTRSTQHNVNRAQRIVRTQNQQPQQPKSSRQALRQSGMMFGGRR